MGMTNGEMIQKVFNCEVCEPIPEDDIIHVIFTDKNDSAIGFDWSWWNMEYKGSTTKNNLGVDCISRIQAIDAFPDLLPNIGYNKKAITEILQEVPPVTPQEPQSFKWCDTCKEYDQENHCCHRWSKVIRDTVAEMKHKYIERDVLDKIRAEIDKIYKREGNSVDCLNALDELKWVIDKYKAESEDKNE